MTNLDLKILKMMLKIRLTEEEISRRYSEGKMRCPTHLSIGQEAVPAVLSAFLEVTDTAVSTHRGHAHYLAKGGNLKKMIAEIYGKSTGCSSGKGGSMHLIDVETGFMGTSAIVGNSIPIGVGLGFSFKLDKSPNISVVYFGDGATEEGAYYESLNFAAVHNLPILFVCENNFYSVYSPKAVRQPLGRSICSVSKEMGVKATKIDGNNVRELLEKIDPILTDIRTGNGPYLIECETYRWREHCGPNYDDNLDYRPEAEKNDWFNRDPIAQFLESVKLSDSKLSNLRAEISEEVEEAFKFAENSPFPNKKEAYTGEFA